MPWPSGKPFSPETREKIAARNRGRTHSEETKAKISQGNKGKTMSLEAIEKSRQTRLANIAKLTPEEYRKRFPGGGNTGKKHSEETKAKMSAAHKGRKHSPEARANMSEGQRKRHINATEEERQAFSEMRSRTSKGREHSPEARANMSKAQYQRWANYTPEEREAVRQKLLPNVFAAWKKSAETSAYTSIELKMAELLDADGLEYITQKKLGPYYVDFFIPALKQVIEVNGCYWHCCIPCGFEDQRGQHDRDRRKLGWLKKHGHDVYVIWEHDLNAS